MIAIAVSTSCKELHMSDPWIPFESNITAMIDEPTRPLSLLARGEVPAIIVRQAFPQAECSSLIEHLMARGYMLPADDDRLAEQALDADRVDQWTRQKLNPGDSKRKRVDVGASLGNFGHDPDDFFARAQQAARQFNELFTGRANPIDTLYDQLRRLAVDKEVATAYENGGRVYGSAIIRIHYGGYTYGPHFDSVRLREEREQYSVYRFQHQFAGVLCLQNAVRDGRTAQGMIHRQFWKPEIDSVLKNNRFHEYAEENAIEHVTVELEPGDLYFFNTGMIHEVPGVDGDMPRVVLATFIGFSEDDNEVLVWS